MSKIAIVYGSNRGNTKNVAEKIQEKIGNADIFNVKEIELSALAPYDYIIFGTSTIGHGELIKPWLEKVDEIAAFDFTGKKVALFGLGNARYHGDTFAQGVSHLYQLLKDKVLIEGTTSTEGYTFSTSQSVVDGKFVALIIDQDNEGEKTDARIDAWLKTLSF